MYELTMLASIGCFVGVATSHAWWAVPLLAVGGVFFFFVCPEEDA